MILWNELKKNSTGGLVPPGKMIWHKSIRCCVAVEKDMKNGYDSA